MLCVVVIGPPNSFQDADIQQLFGEQFAVLYYSTILLHLTVNLHSRVGYLH